MPMVPPSISRARIPTRAAPASASVQAVVVAAATHRCHAAAHGAGIRPICRIARARANHMSPITVGPMRSTQFVALAILTVQAVSQVQGVLATVTVRAEP
jgi:hypothetical protein